MIKRVLTIIGTVVGISAGLLAFNAYFVSQVYHDKCMAGMESSIQQIQRNSAIQNAHNEVYYWMRQEMHYKSLCYQYPNDNNLKIELNNVIKQRMMAEDRLRRLQGR